MDIQIATVFCLCDALLKAFNHQPDPQTQMSDAEIMTTALVATLFFGANFETARNFLETHGYIPNMLSKSRFNRRLHRIKPLFITLFEILGESFIQLNKQKRYAVDTIPIVVCDNIRIRRSKIYTDETFRGYQSSKRRYFYGLKIHLLVTAQRQPVEFFLTPGSTGDVEGLQYFDFDLPPGSRVYGDKAYNNYEIEDSLAEAGVELKPIRKKNSKRQCPPWEAYLVNYYRKSVEATASLMERLLPRSIHAVTPQGFELKVVLFVVATSINQYKPTQNLLI